MSNANLEIISHLATFELKNLNDVWDSVFPYHQRKKSCIDEFELFMSIMPRDANSNSRWYKQLAHDLFTWDTFFDMFKYRLFTFQDFINNDEFLDIVNIHAKLITLTNGCARTDGIVPTLAFLMKRKINFLIPFVYLTGYVPPEYMSVNLVLFGKAVNYPELIAKAKTDIKNSNLTSFGSLKTILEAFQFF
jgi:hypothetical protein